MAFHLEEFTNARYTLKKANGGGKGDEGRWESCLQKKQNKNGTKLSNWGKKTNKNSLEEIKSQEKLAWSESNFGNLFPYKRIFIMNKIIFYK